MTPWKIQNGLIGDSSLDPGIADPASNGSVSTVENAFASHRDGLVRLEISHDQILSMFVHNARPAWYGWDKNLKRQGKLTRKPGVMFGSWRTNGNNGDNEGGSLRMKSCARNEICLRSKRCR
jgi:hypothetical protein